MLVSALCLFKFHRIPRCDLLERSKTYLVLMSPPPCSFEFKILAEWRHFKDRENFFFTIFKILFLFKDRRQMNTFANQ